MIAYELLIILMMLRWVWKSCPELKLWLLLTKSMISTEREEIICGIITMLYINKYHSYNLNWGVIHRILWFFLPSNRINHVKTFSSPTRLVPPQDSRHWTGNLAKNNAKVQNGTKSFSFFFLFLSLGFLREILSWILLPEFSIYFRIFSYAKIIVFWRRTSESTMQKINLTNFSHLSYKNFHNTAVKLLCHMTDFLAKAKVQFDTRTFLFVLFCFV